MLFTSIIGCHICVMGYNEAIFWKIRTYCSKACLEIDYRNIIVVIKNIFFIKSKNKTYKLKKKILSVSNYILLLFYEKCNLAFGSDCLFFNDTG